MSEYRGRGRYGGGGGYRGDRRRGGRVRRGGYHSRPHPASMEQNYEAPFKAVLEQEQDRVTTLWYKAGEAKTTSFSSIVNSLASEYNSGDKVFLKAFKLCITQVPFRIQEYALLTGLLNAANHDLGIALFATASSALNEALEKSDFRAAKLMVRYFACCLNANVILPAQFIALLDSFIGVNSEMDITIQRSDMYIFCVMASLPWCAEQLCDRNMMELERLHQNLQEYMSRRPGLLVSAGILEVHKALSVYKDTNSDIVYAQTDQLELLWQQIQELKSNNWKAEILADPFTFYSTSLSNQLSLEISDIVIPSSVSIVKFFYQPKFWIFNDSVNIPGEKTICHLPSVLSISRFILDDMITDTIGIFSLNHIECTRLLLSTEKCLNLDFLLNNQYQVYESVVECIFAEMLRFPKPREKLVYYTALIMDLCKESLDKIPSILGRSIKLMFNRLDGSTLAFGMDVEGIRRFSEFFAFHLSNFGFSWKWNDWSRVLAQDSSNPSAQFVFVREVLEKCIRLSYYDRIKNSIPETFEKHGRVFPSAAPTFTFRYGDADSTGDQGLFEVVKDLNTSISSREDEASVQQFFEKVVAYVSAHAQILDNSMNVLAYRSSASIPQEAVLQCIMYQGHKSFTHLLNVIEAYLPFLQRLNETEEARMLTTQIIFDFWAQNTQFLEIILGKLVNYKVIDSTSIVSFLLSAEILDYQHARLYVWSILRSTLLKVNLQVRDLSEKLVKLREDISASSMIDINADNIAETEEALRIATKEKKDIFLLTFKAFVNVLKEKIEEHGDIFFSTSYWRWVSGQMLQIGREFQTEIDQTKVTIDAIVFSSVKIEAISEIWFSLQKIYEVQD